MNLLATNLDQSFEIEPDLGPVSDTVTGGAQKRKIGYLALARAHLGERHDMMTFVDLEVGVAESAREVRAACLTQKMSEPVAYLFDFALAQRRVALTALVDTVEEPAFRKGVFFFVHR